MRLISHQPNDNLTSRQANANKDIKIMQPSERTNRPERKESFRKDRASPRPSGFSTYVYLHLRKARSNFLCIKARGTHKYAYSHYIRLRSSLPSKKLKLTPMSQDVVVSLRRKFVRLVQSAYALNSLQSSVNWR